MKRLYDKGFANRPSTIRQEDLLRRFLDGLSDVTASQQVEFVKEPTNIDIAVVEVKAYQETSRQSKGKGNYKRVYMVRPADDDDGEKDDVDSEDKGKIRMTRLPNKNSSKGKDVNHKTLGTNEANMQEDFKKIYEQLAQMQTDFKLHLNQLETKVKDSSSTNLQSRQSGGQYKQRSHTSNGRQTIQQSIVCFVCGVQGHMTLHMNIGGAEIIKKVTVANIHDDCLLGEDILLGLEQGPFDFHLSENRLQWNGISIPCIQVKNSFSCKVLCASDCVIPGYSEKLVDTVVLSTDPSIWGWNGSNFTWSIEGTRKHFPW